MAAAHQPAGQVRGDQADKAHRPARRNAYRRERHRQQQHPPLHAGDANTQRRGTVIAERQHIQIAAKPQAQRQQEQQPRRDDLNEIPATSPQAAGQPQQRAVDLHRARQHQVIGQAGVKGGQRHAR